MHAALVFLVLSLVSAAVLFVMALRAPDLPWHD